MMRHIRHLWKIGAVAALLCVVSAAPSAPYSNDAVEELRQALRVPIDSEKKVEKDYRRSSLEKARQALTIGELRRALLLQEWRDEDRDEAISQIDSDVRKKIAEDLQNELRKILVNNSGMASRLAAITEIGEMGTSVQGPSKKGVARELAPELVKQLDEGPPLLREAAARALGKINPDAKLAAPALGKLLTASTSTPGERIAAADGLDWLMRTLDEMSKGKKTPGVEVNRDIVVEMGSAVVTEAQRGLRDPEFQVRRYSLETIQLTAKMLQDQVPQGPTDRRFPPSGRVWTADERGEVEKYKEELKKDNKAMDPLLNAMEKAVPTLNRTLDTDSRAEIRYLSAKALEQMAEARRRILSRSESIPVESGSSEKKESRGKSATTGLLQLVAATQLVAENEAQARPAAASDPLLNSLDQSLVPLASRFTDPNWRVRMGAADALLPFGAAVAPIVPLIARGLNDPDHFMRWATTLVLAKIGPVDTTLTVPLLANLLCDPDLDVRLAAASTLAGYGPQAKAAVPALADAATSGDADQRRAAIRALQAIGPDAAAALPALIAALKNVEDIQTRRLAAETLGRLRGLARGAIPALEQAVFDVDDTVRKAASDALLLVTQSK